MEELVGRDFSGGTTAESKRDDYDVARRATDEGAMSAVVVAIIVTASANDRLIMG